MQTHDSEPAASDLRSPSPFDGDARDLTRNAPVLQRPTIGRIVQFIESGRLCAALVVFVNDDETVNLTVFGHEGNMFARTNVKSLYSLPVDERIAKNAEQRWHWPPRV